MTIQETLPKQTKKDRFGFGGFWFWGRGLAILTILAAVWDPIAGGILFHIFLFALMGYAYFKQSKKDSDL